MNCDSIYTKFFPYQISQKDVDFFLFCLPHAGGNAYSFAPWRKGFSKGIEVIPIQLPGRGNRIKEPMYREMEQLVEDLHKAISIFFRGKPFGFFGHSMGGLVSIALCQKLETRGIKPTVTILSSCSSYHCNQWRIDQLSDKDFLIMLKKYEGLPKKILEKEELIRFFLPCIKNDFLLCQRQRLNPRPQLSCPLYYFFGRQDQQINHSDAVEEWKPFTSHSSIVKEFSGGHFYLFEEKNTLCQEIERIIQKISP